MGAACIAAIEVMKAGHPRDSTRVHSSGPGSSVLVCDVCGLFWTEPSPAVDYSQYTDELRDRALWKRFARPMVDVALEERPPTGTWVDFGCGGGELLEVAQEAGYEAVGIETDQRALAQATAAGLRVLTDLSDVPHQVDVLSMSHVLEHLEEPRAQLIAARKALLPGGLLVVAQPDPRGLASRLLGRRWSGWQLQEHLWHFTQEYLSRLIQQSGFGRPRIVEVGLHHRARQLRAAPLATAGVLSNRLGRADSYVAVARRL